MFKCLIADDGEWDSCESKKDNLCCSNSTCINNMFVRAQLIVVFEVMFHKFIFYFVIE